MSLLTKEILFENTVRIAGRFIILLILCLPVVLIINSIPILKENSPIDLLFNDWDPDNLTYGLRSFILTSLLCMKISSIKMVWLMILRKK